MKVEYDREADILYIKLRNSRIVNTRLLSEDFYVDLDKNENFVGIEIWQASKNAISPISRDIAQEVKTAIETNVHRTSDLWHIVSRFCLRHH